MTHDSADDLAATIARRLRRLPPLDLRATIATEGLVTRVGDGVAHVAGLRGAGYEELVTFSSGAQGMAYDLTRELTGVILLSEVARVRAGDRCQATGKLPSLPVRSAMLGRLLDPLGVPLDDLPAPFGDPQPVLRPAAILTERAPVRAPLVTGIMAVDAAIPIGIGQRQLIVGDRNVGKTALALDIVAAQTHTGVKCIYVVIGQPISRALGIRDALAKIGALDHTLIIAADAADPPGLQYLAPYSAMTAAEHFCRQGDHAVVVFDDLTKHADAYRELALLLGRSPGREAFPGDIFYIHAQLLERATAYAPTAGGGSVTAFPIVETTDSDISGYIPTNLISITDGQIYLDSARFERNQRPAVDIGRSVSRIGGAAQLPAMRHAAKNIRIDMARFESLETLTRVGIEIDPRTQAQLRRGQVMRELLRQPRFTLRTLPQQILALTATTEGWLDDLPLTSARDVLWRAAANLSDVVELRDWVKAIVDGVEVPTAATARLAALVAAHRPSSSGASKSGGPTTAVEPADTASS